MKYQSRIQKHNYQLQKIKDNNLDYHHTYTKNLSIFMFRIFENCTYKLIKCYGGGNTYIYTNNIICIDSKLYGNKIYSNGKIHIFKSNIFHSIKINGLIKNLYIKDNIQTNLKHEKTGYSSSLNVYGFPNTKLYLLILTYEQFCIPRKYGEVQSLLNDYIPNPHHILYLYNQSFDSQSKYTNDEDLIYPPISNDAIIKQFCSVNDFKPQQIRFNK